MVSRLAMYGGENGDRPGLNYDLTHRPNLPNNIHAWF